MSSIPGGTPYINITADTQGRSTHIERREGNAVLITDSNYNNSANPEMKIYSSGGYGNGYIYENGEWRKENDETLNVQNQDDIELPDADIEEPYEYYTLPAASSEPAPNNTHNEEFQMMAEFLSDPDNLSTYIGKIESGELPNAKIERDSEGNPASIIFRDENGLIKSEINFDEGRVSSLGKYDSMQDNWLQYDAEG